MRYSDFILVYLRLYLGPNCVINTLSIERHARYSKQIQVNRAMSLVEIKPRYDRHDSDHDLETSSVQLGGFSLFWAPSITGFRWK